MHRDVGMAHPSFPGKDHAGGKTDAAIAALMPRGNFCRRQCVPKRNTRILGTATERNAVPSRCLFGKAVC
jgi:hypothetical protein